MSGSAFYEEHRKEVVCQCGWCLKITSGPFAGTKPGFKLSDASHGICEDCEPKFFIDQTVKRIQRIASSYKFA